MIILEDPYVSPELAAFAAIAKENTPNERHMAT